MRNIVKEIAIIIVALTLLVMGLIFATLPDKYARESFGDGTCQECGHAKYRAVGLDRHGYTIYECPECYDDIKIYKP